MASTAKRSGVADDLAALLDAEDPRTLAEMKAGDDWQEGPITEATRGDTGWSIGWIKVSEQAAPSSGTYGAFIADEHDSGITPCVGQTIRFYGRGFGYEFHGIDIDGEEVFWRTPLERVAARVEWLAQHDRDKRERYVEVRERIAADYAGLSAPLRARIDRFRAANPTFGIDSEAYEMFACAEADKIAAHLAPHVDPKYGHDALYDPAARVAAFYDLPCEEQKAAAGLSDGHSGNTFDGACSLARAILSGSEV